MASRATPPSDTAAVRQLGGGGGGSPLAPFGQLSLLLFSSLEANRFPVVIKVATCCAPLQSVSPRLFRSISAFCWITPVFVYAIGSSVLSLLCDYFVSHHRRFQWIPTVRSLTDHRIALVWSFCLAPVWNPIVYYHLDVLSSCMSVHHLHQQCSVLLIALFHQHFVFLLLSKFQFASYFYYQESSDYIGNE